MSYWILFLSNFTNEWRHYWHLLIIGFGEGNGTPLQYFCLENPMDWRSLVGCSPWGRAESDTTERLPFHFSLSCIGEGNGNPLQYSCLENPMDKGVWGTIQPMVSQESDTNYWLNHCQPGFSGWVGSLFILRPCKLPDSSFVGLVECYTITCVRACVLSCFSRVQFFVTPWTVACQAPLSKGFSRQEYWSGLPCPPILRSVLNPLKILSDFCRSL